MGVALGPEQRGVDVGVDEEGYDGGDGEEDGHDEKMRNQGEVLGWTAPAGEICWHGGLLDRGRFGVVADEVVAVATRRLEGMGRSSRWWVRRFKNQWLPLDPCLAAMPCDQRRQRQGGKLQLLNSVA